MDKEEKDVLTSLDNKLSLIVNLLLRKEELTIKDKVALIDNVSLSNTDASRILGISETHFAKEKSLLKKRSTTQKDIKMNETKEQEIKDDSLQTEQ